MIPIQPSFISQPFAQNGDKNTIPNTGGDLLGLASLSLGFPKITETPLELGGIPPQRKDFNGILHSLSAFAFFLQSGGVFTYSATSNYTKPAVVMYNNVFYFCIKENGVDSANGVKAPTDTEYWTPFIDYLLEGLAVGTPIGTIIMWASSTNPQDGGVWLDCDGSSYNTTTYAKLYAILGSGNLPNLKGLFPRCVGTQDLSVTINNETSTQTFDGGDVGDKSADAIRNITGKFYGYDNGYTNIFRGDNALFISSGNANRQQASDGNARDANYIMDFDTSKVVPVGSENKPASISLRFLIKAK